eukprot:m.154253 g.154253  ORF g.154253 m.154253 type:complete len:230 (+) comp17494_c1_seq1:442-1131(+)
MVRLRQALRVLVAVGVVFMVGMAVLASMHPSGGRFNGGGGRTYPLPQLLTGRGIRAHLTDADTDMLLRRTPNATENGGRDGQGVSVLSDADTACQHSATGPALVVDDRGFVCLQGEPFASGCCPRQTADKAPAQYSCATCREDHCCAEYEFCVSCCLSPTSDQVLRRVLTSNQRPVQPLLRLVSNRFELCVAHCRTTSLVVQHENKFRDDAGKFCYGVEAPPLKPSAVK